VIDLGQIAAKHGVNVLDAAITDAFGVQGVAAGTASFLVGGDAEALESARPLLQASAAHIFHLGDLGSGMTVKIIRNFSMYVTLLAAFEGRELAAAAGIDRQTVREIFQTTGASSRAMDHYLMRTQYDDAYRERLPALVEIFAKDVGLALELGKRWNIDLPGGEAVQRSIRMMLSPPQDSN